ncbi:SH3 domain-binding glutamic acid-rich-like protein 3 [Spea bombifrons]|uniref:SH3 domain-binding glutamic acid-rich-like protein 3 n=1 Tax=Spea bombifrons TaxID=233779 RepID=UPI00234B0C22|nr:SH3 domain-binding glutamic acid-rich-like protein 3 [Spea bombifrons]
MVVKVYITSVTGSREIKSQQCEVMRILDSKSIVYETVDISVDNKLREEMRDKAGDPKACPPQIFNGDEYCGGYELLAAAAEEEIVDQFLKLKA